MFDEYVCAVTGLPCCGCSFFCEHRKKGKNIMTKMKAMLSQPMAGKTEQEIVDTRERAIKVLKEKGFEIVNTLFTDEWYSKEKMEERGVVNIPLCFLAKSLENMSLCNAAHNKSLTDPRTRNNIRVKCGDN